MEKYRKVLEESLSDILTSTVQLLPKIILGILGLLFAWIVVKIIMFIIKKILKATKVDSLSEKITKAKLLGEKEVKIDLAKIITTLVKILLILLFTVVIAQVLGLYAISDGVVAIFAYLPTLFSALLILAGGLYFATLVKKATLSLLDSTGVGGSKFISGALFYLIAFFVTITALNQAGIGTEIITANFTLILGAFLAAIALGFGLGSREVISDLLKMFYVRWRFMVGDKLVIDDLQGTVESIYNISLTLKTKAGKIVVPIGELTSKRVEIKE